jgi:hypothetical protein
MAAIQLTDDPGPGANATLAPFSASPTYFHQLPASRMDSGAFSKVAGLTLDVPALAAVNRGLLFDNNVKAVPPWELQTGPIQAVVIGESWGLVAMGLQSCRKASDTIPITGPKLVGTRYQTITAIGCL